MTAALTRCSGPSDRTSQAPFTAPRKSTATNRTTDCLNLNQDHAESISYTSSVDVASPSSWRGFKGAAAAGSPRPRLRRWHDGGSDRNYRADGINLRWAQHAVQAAKVGQRGHTARHGRSTSRDHDDAKD